MKMLAETTGDFMLLDLGANQSMDAFRPSVVARSAFIDARIALSQIVKISDVPDDATDAEFAEYWDSADGDKELAVSSYLSKFDGQKPAQTRKKK